MKRIFLIALTVLLIAFPSISFAAQGMYGATSLTGSATNSVDSIPEDLLEDGSACIAWVSDDAVYFYIFDAASTSAESSPSVIAPDDSDGTGRWVQVDPNGMGAGSGDLSSTDIDTEVEFEALLFELVVPSELNYFTTADETDPDFATWLATFTDDTGTDDQTATEVPFTPYSTIAATNVQTAIQEVLDESTGGTDDQNATEVPVSTTNFGGIFANDTTSDTVQETLDLADDHNHSGVYLEAETDPTVDSSAKIQAIIGADVYQPADADLDTYAGITPTADGQALLASADANPFTDADELALDSAIQPGDLGAAATSNDANDLDNRPNTEIIYNNTGVTISQGKVVEISGSGGGYPLGILADKDTSVQADGIAIEDIGPATTGTIQMSGVLQETWINTLAETGGDPIFMGDDGNYTTTKPGTGNVIFLGKIGFVAAASGSLLLNMPSIVASYDDLNDQPTLMAPTAHASTHATGESDAIAPADIGAEPADATIVKTTETNVIDSDMYVDGSIDAEHLAADVIDESKIADDGVDSEHYNDNSIDDAHLNITGGLAVILDGGGLAIAADTEVALTIPYAMTITSATVLADQSGSIVVDIWVDSLANYPPTDADSITSSTPPTITSDTDSTDTTLTSWTTTLTAGQTVIFHVDSCTSIERATIILGGTR